MLLCVYFVISTSLQGREEKQIARWYQEVSWHGLCPWTNHFTSLYFHDLSHTGRVGLDALPAQPSMEIPRFLHGIYFKCLGCSQEWLLVYWPSDDLAHVFY